jgi:hypothetical protein
MSFNLDKFTHIVSTIEDTLGMLDDAQLAISTEVEKNNDENYSYMILNLSFPLRNGSGKISIGDDYGVAEYYNNTGELLKEIEFDDCEVYDIKSPFNLAVKGIIAADKQNNQSKAKSNPGIPGDATLDRVRAELSGIN